MPASAAIAIVSGKAADSRVGRRTSDHTDTATMVAPMGRKPPIHHRFTSGSAATPCASIQSGPSSQ